MGALGLHGGKGMSSHGTVGQRGNLPYRNLARLRWGPQNWQSVDDEQANEWFDRDRGEPWYLPKV